MKLKAACVLIGVMCGTTAVAQEPFVVLHYNTNTNESESHTIQRGETLNGILRKYFGATASLKSLARETVDGNPHAFRGGDPNRMLMGQRLKLPAGHGGAGEVDDIYFF